MVKWFYNSKLAKWLTPLGTCHTITLGCIVLTENPKEKVTQRLRLHETTHAYQFIELAILGLVLLVAMPVLFGFFNAWLLIPALLLFYVWYGIEWLIRFVIALKDGYKRDAWHIAYKNTVFEQEANEIEKGILDREILGWLNYYNI